MAAGEAVGCFALTEPGAGSDPRRCRPRRGGSGRTGSSTAPSDGSGSRRSRTSRSSGRAPDDGIRGFVVPTRRPGLQGRDDPRQALLRASRPVRGLAGRLPRAPRRDAPRRAPPAGSANCLDGGALRDHLGGDGRRASCYEAALEYSQAPRCSSASPSRASSSAAKLADATTGANAGPPYALPPRPHERRRHAAPERCRSASSTTPGRRSRSPATVRGVLGGSGITLDHPIHAPRGQPRAVADVRGHPRGPPAHPRPRADRHPGLQLTASGREDAPRGRSASSSTRGRPQRVAEGALVALGTATSASYWRGGRGSWRRGWRSCPRTSSSYLRRRPRAR